MNLETGEDTDKDPSHEGARYSKSEDEKPWLNDLNIVYNKVKIEGMTEDQARQWAIENYRINRANRVTLGIK